MKVTIFGHHYISDENFFDSYTKDNLKITWRKPTWAYQENTEEWKHIWKECETEDLVLIAAFGNYSAYWTHNINLYEPYFSKIKKLAHWSFDSHNDDNEKNVRKYFTDWLVAHTNCEKNTGPNTIYLPGCYWQNGYLQFIDLLKNVEPSKDVVFHHHCYPIGDREFLCENIIKYIEELKLSYDFSVISGPSQFVLYTKSLLGCKVGLNMSLLNDLNLRNFEVWMVNKPLLTNYLPEYELFPELKQYTVFYNRDLSNFKEKLLESLNKKVNSRQHIIKNHMLTNRYLDAINLIMGSNFKINFPTIDI